LRTKRFISSGVMPESAMHSSSTSTKDAEVCSWTQKIGKGA
jgi:hypothetical protein